MLCIHTDRKRVTRASGSYVVVMRGIQVQTRMNEWAMCAPVSGVFLCVTGDITHLRVYWCVCVRPLVYAYVWVVCFIIRISRIVISVISIALQWNSISYTLWTVGSCEHFLNFFYHFIHTQTDLRRARTLSVCRRSHSISIKLKKKKLWISCLKQLIYIYIFIYSFLYIRIKSIFRIKKNEIEFKFVFVCSNFNIFVVCNGNEL